MTIEGGAERVLVGQLRRRDPSPAGRPRRHTQTQGRDNLSA